MSICYMLLFGFGHHKDGHVASCQHWHLIDFAIFLKAFSEFEKLKFAVVLIDDAAAAESHDDLHLVAVLQEADGVVAFEFHVMFADLRAQTDFFDFRLGAVRFDFLQFLLLLVQVLLVVHYLAHGRSGLGGDFHQVQTEQVGERKRLT